MRPAMSQCFFLLLILFFCTSEAAGGKKTRYLLYSVNPGEGFNLRRDVHMRAATLVHMLRETGDWVLVLPPWPRLSHWRTPSKHSHILWEHFFDLESLNEYVPSIEFHSYLQRNGRVIDEVMVLQDFDQWAQGNWGVMEEKPCLKPSRYHQKSDGVWEGWVFGRDDLEIHSHRCMSTMGMISLLLPHLQSNSHQHKSFLVEHFEILLHERFGEVDYWRARESMVYASHLREAGARFMRERLDYDPGEGKGREPAKDGGGDYIAVHMRRQDYIHAHRGDVPSLEGAADQLKMLKKEQKIKKVFLASDAPPEEKKALQKMVKGLVWYTPTDTELHNYGDGGVAIIDQWISAHAKHFIGTAHSTFSFRIREDRQLLGFSYESTYNDLCGPSNNEHDPHSCDRPTYWKLVDLPPKFPGSSGGTDAAEDHDEL